MTDTMPHTFKSSTYYLIGNTSSLNEFDELITCDHAFIIQNTPPHARLYIAGGGGIIGCMNYSTWMEKQAISTSFVNRALLNSLKNGFRDEKHLQQIGRILRKNMTREYARALDRSTAKYGGAGDWDFLYKNEKLFGRKTPVNLWLEVHEKDPEMFTNPGGLAFKHLARHFSNRRSIIDNTILGNPIIDRSYRNKIKNLLPDTRLPGYKTLDVINKIKWWQDVQGPQFNIRYGQKNRNIFNEYVQKLHKKINGGVARRYPDAYDEFVYANNKKPALINKIFKKYSPYYAQNYGNTKIIDQYNYEKYIPGSSVNKTLSNILAEQNAPSDLQKQLKENTIKDIVTGKINTSGFIPASNVIAMHPRQKSISTALHENGHKHSTYRDKDYMLSVVSNKNMFGDINPALTINEELAASHAGASVIRPLQRLLKTKMPPPRSTYAGVPSYMLSQLPNVNTYLHNNSIPTIDFDAITRSVPINWRSHGSIKDLYKHISPVQREHINKAYNTMLGTNADWFRELEKLENLSNRLGRN